MPFKVIWSETAFLNNTRQRKQRPPALREKTPEEIWCFSRLCFSSQWVYLLSSARLDFLCFVRYCIRVSEGFACDKSRHLVLHASCLYLDFSTRPSSFFSLSSAFLSVFSRRRSVPFTLHRHVNISTKSKATGTVFSHALPSLPSHHVLKRGGYFWCQLGRCTVTLLYHVSKQAWSAIVILRRDGTGNMSRSCHFGLSSRFKRMFLFFFLLFFRGILTVALPENKIKIWLIVDGDTAPVIYNRTSCVCQLSCRGTGGWWELRWRRARGAISVWPSYWHLTPDLILKGLFDPLDRSLTSSLQFHDDKSMRTRWTEAVTSDIMYVKLLAQL